MYYYFLAQVASMRQQEQVFRQEVARLTESLQQAAASAGNPQQTTELPLPGTATVSLMLSPGLVRGNSQANLLPFPVGVSRARLLLKREHEDYAGYTVALETAEGSPILRQTGLTGQPAGHNTKVIIVELTPSVLRRGDYVLRLFATRSGKLDEIEDYSFRIVRR